MRNEVIQVGSDLRRHAGMKQHIVVVPWAMHNVTNLLGSYMWNLLLPSKTEQLGMPRKKIDFCQTMSI